MSTLEEAEQVGRQAAEKLGARSLADLRMKSAEEIQKGLPGGRSIVDGWYLTDDTSTLIAEGKSNDVDVLVGSNRDEGAFPFFGVPRGNAQEFTAAVRQRFGSQADAFLKLYPTSSDAESNASQLAAFRDEVAWRVRSWAAARARKGKAYEQFHAHVDHCGPGPRRDDDQLLGELCKNWRPERCRSARVAGVQGRRECRVDDLWADGRSGTSSRSSSYRIVQRVQRAAEIGGRGLRRYALTSFRSGAWCSWRNSSASARTLLVYSSA